MKQYSISYVSNSGFFVLNDIVEADNKEEAISSIRGDVGVRVIMSIVTIKE